MNNKQLETTLLTIKNYVDTTTMNHFVHTAAVDVDTLKTTGIYSLTSNCTNNATANAGTMIVDFNVGTPYQLWIPDNTHTFYKRNWDKTNSVWKSWSNKITGSITGNADGNAGTATKLKTARTIALTGDATGSTSFDGSGNVNIEVSIDGAGNAGSADKVNNPMTIQLNSGTTEGTNKFTFDGSAAKSVNITPSSIGAAASSHGTHVTYATATPKANGTAAVGTVNRVAREDHVHPLQTTVSGNAGSADKLKTARTISLAGDASGEATFDGTEDVQISVEVKNDSHSHSNYVTKSGATMSGDLTISKSGARYVSTNGTNSMWTGINSGGTTIGMYDQTGEKYIVSKNLETGAVTLAGNADTASKLASERTITLGGDLSGSVNFDGSKNVTLTANVANDSHTHKYAGSSSAGGAATSANKVNKSLKVQLNGGTTEGTNQYTFDGSTATTINITPSSIGAATASHGTHLTLGTGAGNAYYGDKGNIAYTHSQEAHAPVDAQKNSDITKSEIEAKLTGDITKHYHTVLTMKTDNFKDASALPSTYPRGESLFFSNNLTENKFKGLTYGLVQTLKHYGSGPAATQWLYPYNDNKNKIFVRQAFYNTDAWEEWAEVYTSLNKPTPASIGTYTNTEIETKLSGKSNTDHTHNYAGSSTPGGAATSANKVNKSLTLQFNGTTKATFDGSSAKTVNITPSAIGASASGHNHDDRYFTETEINNKITTINAAIASAQADAQAYADQQITALVDSAPDAMNTLKELATAITTNKSTYDAYVTTVNNALNGKAPTSHANSATTYGAASASLYGHAMASSTTPKANGTAAVGSETAKFARGDHVHPLQTTVSGNAGSADKVNSNLVVKLNGGSTEGTNMYTFNGSAAKTVNITPNGIGAANGSTKAATTAATAGWYRIAQTKADIQNVIGLFVIRGQVNSHHTSAIITAGITYGKNPTLNQLAYTTYGTGLTKARIVYHSTYSGNYAYLEVYLAQAAATTITVDLLSNLGWTLVSPSTAGSIPSGYIHTEITFVVNKIVASIKGSLDGNAGTATQFKDNKTVKLTGDVTGEVSSKAGWTVATKLVNSGVSAGSYGPSTNITAAHGGTINIPYITVDEKGRVTTAKTTTITLPADNNTDTKVTNTLNTTTKAYITGTTSATTSTGTQVFDTGVYLDTKAGQLVATTFKGNLTGNVTGNVSGNVSGSSGTCTGNSASASKLEAARSIGLGGILSGSANFDGSAGITISASVAKPPKSGDWWSGGLATVSTDGVMEIGKYIDLHNSDTSTNDYDVRIQSGGASKNVVTLPTGTGTLALTTDNVASATKLATARNIKLTGDVSGSATFDGTTECSITTTVANDSHTHSTYLPLAGGIVTGNLVLSGAGIQTTKAYDGTTAYTATPLGISYTQTGDTGNGTASTYSATLTVNQSSNRQFQICINNSANTFAFRAGHSSNTGGTGEGWTAWKKVYHEGNKPSASDIGAAPSSHTHKYAGSSSIGGAANSVANSLTVQFNGGNKTGTNKFTFNGGAATTINITPDAIGAAAKSHGTHVSYGGTGSATTVSRSDHYHISDSEVTTSLTNAFGASYIPTK